MDPKAISASVSKQDWLEPVADGMANAIDKTFKAGGEAGKIVEDALNGVWLGHPLHSVLIALPIGAWTVAAILDIVESQHPRSTHYSEADAALGIGLAGALASAVTGFVQWYPIKGKPTRKVGAAHALLNISATLIYGASWTMRRQGNREAGRVLGWIGLGVVAVSGYLGGTMAYEQHIGADHAPRKGLPEEFTPVLALSDLEENKPHLADAKGIPVVLVRKGDQVFALANSCAHLAGPLNEGELKGDCIVCPWHGSEFDLKTGDVKHGPSTYPQPNFEARINDGQIEIRAAKSPHNKE